MFARCILPDLGFHRDLEPEITIILTLWGNTDCLPRLLACLLASENRAMNTRPSELFNRNQFIA
jgi:hypothetical protein